MLCPSSYAVHTSQPPGTFNLDMLTQALGPSPTSSQSSTLIMSFTFPVVLRLCLEEVVSQLLLCRIPAPGQLADGLLALYIVGVGSMLTISSVPVPTSASHSSRKALSQA
jgi:hypothetical protein